MSEETSVYLTLDEAQAMIARGVEQAARLRQAGAIVVVDAGGSVVSISRMDDSPVASVAVARAKAYTAAVQGRPTALFAANAHERPETFFAFQSILPQQPFPGPGGMPVRKGGRVVGGIATGGGIGPFTEIPGVSPGGLLVDGAQANAEDLVICAALRIPYASQHGDRALRDPAPRDEPVARAAPFSLADALRYADRATEKARELGVRVGVAVVDEMGRLLQMDRMDGSPLGSGELAEAKAQTALKFQRGTGTLTEEFRAGSPRMRAIERIVGFTILAMPGGLPILEDGRLLGAIGVSGSGAARAGGGGGLDEVLANAAVSPV